MDYRWHSQLSSRFLFHVCFNGSELTHLNSHGRNDHKVTGFIRKFTSPFIHSQRLWGICINWPEKSHKVGHKLQQPTFACVYCMVSQLFDPSFKRSLGSSHRIMIHFRLANQTVPLGGHSAQIRDAGIRWNMMEYVTWSSNTLTSQFDPCVGIHFHVKVAFLSQQRWTPQPTALRWVTSWWCWCFAVWACYLYGCCCVDCRKNPYKMRASRMVARAVGLFSWDSWCCVHPGYSWIAWGGASWVKRRFMRQEVQQFNVFSGIVHWNLPGILEDLKKKEKMKGLGICDI